MRCKLGMIGGGNMGQAIVRGAIDAGVLGPHDVLVAEIDPARRKVLAELGCATTDDPAGVLGCEQLMLAVKPQSFGEVARTIAPIAEGKVVISIMAGLSSTSIRRALGEQARVVRVMPNTPCQVGAGMAAIALGAGARAGDEALAVAIFNALGETAIVPEAQMHAVTAVSGGGPAYVFLLAEAMQQTAMGLGLDEPTARLLVRQTIYGAGKLLMETDEDAAVLRNAVTSRAGTTEAALSVMIKRDLPGIIVDGITAARNRGRALDER